MASSQAANALFRERLPKRLVDELADGPPEPVGAELVDALLQSSRADGLFRLWLRGQRPLFVYSLIEHKSTPDPRAVLQTLGYMVRIWENEKLIRGASEKLPGIVPMVVYHGARPWTVPPFRDLVDLERELFPGQLDFGVVVVNVGDIEDGKLSSNPTLRAGLMELKYGTRPERQASELRAVLAALRQAPSLIAPGLAYILRTYQRIDRALLLGEVKEVMPEHEGELMSIAAREWLAEGREQGLEQGREQGLEQGHRDWLVRILERRFGGLPDAARARIAAGSTAEVDAWFDGAIDAGTLEEVFGRRH